MRASALSVAASRGSPAAKSSASCSAAENDCSASWSFRSWSACRPASYRSFQLLVDVSTIAPPRCLIDAWNPGGATHRAELFQQQFRYWHDCDIGCLGSAENERTPPFGGVLNDL